MKVLNLYAGIGGNRKLWEDVEVTAVEYQEDIAEVYKKYYPDDRVIVGDAHEYLLHHFKEFDFIWASPPCPTHSKINNTLVGRGQIKERYPDMKLWQEIVFLKYWAKDQLWVIENVIPYYKPFIPGKKVGNHLFWSNFRISYIDEPKRGTCDYGGLSRFDDKGIDYNDLSIIKSTPKDKVLQNIVHYETGLHILNCARNIITKSNVNQLDLFQVD